MLLWFWRWCFALPESFWPFFNSIPWIMIVSCALLTSVAQTHKSCVNLLYNLPIPLAKPNQPKQYPNHMIFNPKRSQTIPNPTFPSPPSLCCRTATAGAGCATTGSANLRERRKLPDRDVALQRLRRVSPQAESRALWNSFDQMWNQTDESLACCEKQSLQGGDVSYRDEDHHGSNSDCTHHDGCYHDKEREVPLPVSWNPHLLKMPFCAVTCGLLALEDHQERRSRVAQKEKTAFVNTTPSTAVL